MHSNRRMSSIARKIHRTWSGKLFRAYLLVNLVVVILAVAGFCYATEQQFPGGFSPDTPKAFIIADDALNWLDLSSDSTSDIAKQLFDMPQWRTTLNTLSYRFVDGYGIWHTAPMDAFLDVFLLMFGNLLICELVFWVLDRLFGSGSARRLVRPLTRISQSAQELTAQQRPDPVAYAADRLHNLEDAIESLEPARQDIRLSTGNEELKGLEDAVNKLLDRMQTTYRDQARFVSDASHELRTPIAVIQGYASMLDRWGKTDESILDESIAAIKSESEHMKTLVEQLLFLARGDSGRQSMAFEPFDLAETMHEVFEESEMIDKDHEWRLDAPEPITCNGDEAMVKQAIRILTDNASKYTPHGGAIMLRVFKSGKQCAFSVQDSGQGIPGEDVAHIFERFYRADPARTGMDKSSSNDSSGTGLGLSIAQWIIKRHDGHFEVLSWPGLGTRFTAFLPVHTR